MVLIIDDRSDVWDGCKNLVPVQPFVFFGGNEQGSDVATTNVSFLESIDDDDQLPKVLNVLQNVHKQFFASDPSTGDVKGILSGMKGRLFHGLHFVFSGCFPIGGDLRPSQQAIWREAELWGAKCSESLSTSTTHLITTRGDTEKVEQAQQRGSIHIVHPSWMYASMVNWTRLPEALYAVQLPVARLSTLNADQLAEIDRELEEISGSSSFAVSEVDSSDPPSLKKRRTMSGSGSNSSQASEADSALMKELLSGEEDFV